MPKFELRKVKDGLGYEVDTLVKIGDDGVEDQWCNVRELDILFNTCVRKWKDNWDLDKVCTAVSEADFD